MNLTASPEIILPPPRLWWDASSVVTDVSNNVTQFVDRSGNAIHGNRAAGTHALGVGVNSRPKVALAAGVNTFTPSATARRSGVIETSYLFVFAPNTATSAGVGMLFNMGAASIQLRLLASPTLVSGFTGASSGTLTVVSGISLVNAALYIFVLTISTSRGASLYYTIPTASDFARATRFAAGCFALNSGDFALGSDSAGNAAAGDLYTVKFWDRALTGPEAMQAIEDERGLYV